MPEQASSSNATRRDTTELRILITEDSTSNLNVEWESVIKGTGVQVPMRASHIAGQLIAAAFIILTKSYAGMMGELAKAVAGAAPIPEDSGKSTTGKVKRGKAPSS